MKDAEGNVLTVQSVIHGRNAVTVPVLDYVGAFHQWVVELRDEQSYTMAVVEKPNGGVTTIPVDDVQFKPDNMQGATHHLNDNYYCYGKDGFAFTYCADAWAITSLTNYELYSDDAYIEIST